MWSRIAQLIFSLALLAGPLGAQPFNSETDPMHDFLELNTPPNVWGQVYYWNTIAQNTVHGHTYTFELDGVVITATITNGDKRCRGNERSGQEGIHVTADDPGVFVLGSFRCVSDGEGVTIDLVRGLS